MEVKFFNFMLTIDNCSIRLYENEKDIGGMSCCDGITPADIKNFMEWLFFNNKFFIGSNLCFSSSLLSFLELSDIP